MKPHLDDHDLGLAADLRTLAAQAATRRHTLRWLLGGGLLGAGGALIAGCGGGGDDASSATQGAGTATTTATATPTTTTTTPTTSTTCSVILEETAGPYPGDGSNGANALTLSGIVRSDIRSSIAGASGVATGVPLTVVLQLVNASGACAALDGYAIYLWHCDALGRYSMYSSGVTAENYLRGVQSTDASGRASFSTIFPGCYSGRMPHIHFEIYRSTNSASSFSNKLRTSQLAFPTVPCNAVYATSAYSGSARNLASTSFASDNVFSDGVATQTANVSGDTTNGYVATLTVGIAG